MICHDYKCILVHVPKTAGQSVEHFFMNLLGLEPTQRNVLLLGKNRFPALGPPQLSHLRASEYLTGEHISDEQFARYFKFSFVRNPWDRIVSFYKYRGHAYRYDFKTFVFKHMPQPGWTNDYCHVMPQYDYLYEGDRLLVDFVGKFEHLQRDFDTVCEMIGIPKAPLPHLNRSLQRHSVLSVLRGEPRKIVRNLKRIMRGGRMQRNTFPHFSQYYDAETRDYVGELYRKDIDAFGYEFPSRPR